MGRSRHTPTVFGINARLLAVGAVGLLLLFLLIFGISSCVRGCSSQKVEETTEEEVQVNPDDKRVAYGASSELTAKLSAVLDRNEAFETIAAHADEIDERLIDLAIAEPEAISFVAGSLKAKAEARSFGASLPQGEYPKIYTFDARWGYAPYADGTIGSVGSGPVALAMASMGLSGKTDHDPASVAAAVSAANLDNGTSGMDEAFLVNHASDAGLTAILVEASADGIYAPISDNLPVVARLKADSGIGSALPHWVLIAKLNSDNSITVLDPTSAIASSHTWSLGAVAGQVDSAYQLGISYDTGTSASTSTTSDEAESTSEEGLEEGVEEDYGY